MHEVDDRNLIIQAVYARSRKARGLPGGTREAVRQAVESGVISSYGPEALIDPAEADRQWAENRLARPATAKNQPASVENGEIGAESAKNGTSTLPGTQLGLKDTGYAAARARREHADAEKAEMELQRKKGELVAYEDVLRGGFEVAREVRDTMIAAEKELAAELASVKTPEAARELLAHHRKAVCEALVRGWREKIGQPPAGGLLP